MRTFLLFLTMVVLVSSPMAISLDNASAQDDCDFVGLLDAWAGATVADMPNGAVFGYMVNLGAEADTLLSATSDVAEAVEIHETTVGEDDVVRMQPLSDGLVVEPHNYVQLQQGSYHIMLINLIQPLEADTLFDLNLVFESAGEVVVSVHVRDMEQMAMMDSMDMGEDASMDDMDIDAEASMDDMSLVVDEACAGVHVLGPWARPGVAMPNSAAYALLVNLGPSDVTLVSAAGSVAEAVELHEMTMGEDDVMRMSPVDGGIVVPAGGAQILEPGGLHIMLIGLAEDLDAGSTISLTLMFDDDTILDIEVPVQDPMEVMSMPMDD